jgi:NTE family protein
MQQSRTTAGPVPEARTALVLGAGGTVGIAYHAGLLKAMADAGVDPSAADLVVGTSAGAIVGSILRAGHDLDEIWDLALSDEHPFIDDEPFFRSEVVFSQGWRTPVGLARRAVGSGYVLHRSLLRWPTVTPPQALQRFYRGGLASVTEQRAEFANWVGEGWPAGQLNLCTFDIVSGRRLVLGEAGRATPALPDAMRAASAVPTLYPPVRLGRRLLVDGAVSSSTNLDVAIAAGAELVVVAAPLGYDPDDRPPLHLRAAREIFQRMLERELGAAEKSGAKVLVIRPDAEEARSHGLNFLRSGSNAATAELSYRRARAVLATTAAEGFAEAWRAAPRPTDAGAVRPQSLRRDRRAAS